ncbi:uncharacterized protein [Littorina saxatilis]|uniref:uncharacterized protein isoform X2 n=1 Tax=Littorina saxatilis TaxID=31220 RepID=UPI0038B43B32
MLILAVAFAAVAVCQGGSFSQLSDPWSSPFSSGLADAWNSAPADSSERANRLEGWQKEKLDEYHERLEEREQSEGLYSAPGLEEVWLNQQDVGLPLGLREQSLWKLKDADLESEGQFFRSEPTRDVIISPEQQQVESGFREYAVHRPEVVAGGVSRRPRQHLFAEEDSPFRRLLLPAGPSRSASHRSALPPSVVYGGPKAFSDEVTGPGSYSPAAFRGPFAPTGSLLDSVPPMVFNRPASVRAPASFRDVVVPAAPFSRRTHVQEEAFLRAPSRRSSSSFLRLLDPKHQLTSLARGYYDNKRQYLFDLMAEVVKFCNCRKTLASMKYWWGGFQQSKMMPQSMEEGRGKPLDDLGFRGQVAFDNFREILSGILPPPRNLQVEGRTSKAVDLALHDC